MSFEVKINPLATNLKESATLEINIRAKKARVQGKDICHLGFGQSPFDVHSTMVESLKKNATKKDYLPTQGMLDLRSSIAQYHQREFSQETTAQQILIGPGSKELIFQALYVLQGPVIVPAPSWVSYGPQVQLQGRDIITLETTRDNDYKMTTKEFLTCCESLENGQKILIFNNPSNPTGAVYSAQEIEELSKIAKNYNVIVISDEIYALINWSGQKYASFSHYLPQQTLITSGLSKSHAAGGWRMGHLIVPENMQNVMKAISAMISETFSCVSAPIQYAAIDAFADNQDLRNYLQQCTKIYQSTSTYLWHRFSEIGLKCPKPLGAFYLFPDFENFKEKLKGNNINNDIDLSSYLFDQYQVAVLPGQYFYFPQEKYAVRVASVDYDGNKVYQASLNNDFIEKYCPRLVTACDRIGIFLKSL